LSTISEVERHLAQVFKRASALVDCIGFFENLLRQLISSGKLSSRRPK
jgi:hypothetical protein